MKTAFLLALALSTASIGAFADEISPAPPTALHLQSAGLASSFEKTVHGPFVDDYTFTPTTFSGKVSVDLMAKTGPVVFFAASLNGQDFGFPSDQAGQTAVHFEAQVKGDMPLTLTVFGASVGADGATALSGSYLGRVTTAVPEPDTAVLFLVGLSAFGLASAVQRRARCQAS